MHHSRLQPRAESRCTLGLRDDADGDFSWIGNCNPVFDHGGAAPIFGLFGKAASTGHGYTMYQAIPLMWLCLRNREKVKLEA